MFGIDIKTLEMWKKNKHKKNCKCSICLMADSSNKVNMKNKRLTKADIKLLHEIFGDNRK